MGRIIFIGGIHGSGKGTICEIIKRERLINHLTASEVLKWEEFSSQEDKQVENIGETQDKLISNLRKIIQAGENYLLDGHYCLLNKNNVPEKIPIETFVDIAPSKLILIIAEPSIIKSRLEKRDLKYYDFDLIDQFQKLEIAYAKEISRVLKKPLLIIDSEDFKSEELLNYI